MKTTCFISLGLLGLLTTSSRCERDEPPPVTPAPAPCPPVPTAVATGAVAGLSRFNSCYTGVAPEIRQSQLFVVNSAAQLRALHQCDTPPSVDFNAHTLLVGRTTTPQGSHVASQRLVQSCQGYTYSVSVQLVLTQNVHTVLYHVLVPKIPANTPVALDVQILP